MLFGRHKRGRVYGRPNEAGASDPASEQQLYHIAFDMMVKGTTHKRRSGTIRQYGVTVNGSTKLVTTGEFVDRETYQALIAAGAIVDLKTGKQESTPDDAARPDEDSSLREGDVDAEER